MIDEFSIPQQNHEHERLRQVVLAARQKARAYLRESGFFMLQGTPANVVAHGLRFSGMLIRR